MTRAEPETAEAAFAAAVEPYPQANALLVRLGRILAADVDGADTASQRTAAVRMLLEVADRLDLVPLAPGRGSARVDVPPPAPAAAPGGDDGDNPFGVPDVSPGVGDPA